MTWVKIDDGVLTHPKFARISAADMGVWAWGAAWSSRELTNGHIPETVLPLLRGTPENAARLVSAGLWEEAEGGWVYHDWNDYQPTPAEVEELRAKRKAAGRKGGRLSARSRSGQASAQASAQANTQANTQANAEQVLKQNASKTEAKSNPVPVPVPEASKEASTYSRKRERDRGYPDDFEAFWAAYPRREGKAAAYREWTKALETVPAETLRTAAARYAADPNRVDAYTAHARTWLSQGRWEDEPLPPRPTGQDRGLEAAQRDLARYAATHAGPAPLEIEAYPWEENYCSPSTN